MSERNNHAVLINASTPELGENSEYFPMLYDGQFLKAESGGKGASKGSYNAFWNDTYLMWELLWYYQKFSLFEYSNNKYRDRIFILYGDGSDYFTINPRYKGERHDEHGWETPYFITDYKADNQHLDTVVYELSEGYEFWIDTIGYIEVDSMGEDDYLYFWTFDHGVSAWITHSVDISDINNPQPLDYSFIAEGGSGIDVEENYAYAVGYYSGSDKGLLTVTDISNPNNLQERGILELESKPEGVDVVGDYAYIVKDPPLEFVIVNISDLDSMFIVYHTDLSGGAPTDIEVKNDRAFISTDGGFWHLYDVSNPEEPNKIAYHYTCAHFHSVSAEFEDSNEYEFYLASPHASSKLYVVHIDGADITETSYSQYKPIAVETDEDYIYLTTGKPLDSLWILNREDPSEVISRSFLSGCNGINISKKDTILYIATYENGVYMVNCSDPENPYLINTYNLEGSFITEAIRKGSNLYVSGFGPEGNKANLYLVDYPISDVMFADKFADVSAGKKVYWMQQCYSGGFIDDLEDSNTIVTTACKASELSWNAEDIPWYRIDDWQSDPNPTLNWEDYVVLGSENEITEDSTYYHGEFNFHIMNVIRRETPNGSSSIGPSTGYEDYLISMSEAYNHVNSWDSRKYAILDSLGDTLQPEHPQYSDNGDIGDDTFFGWDDGLAPLPPESLDYSISPYPPNPRYVIVNLTWNANTEDDLDAYSVYHKKPGGNWGHLAYRKSNSGSHKVRSGTIHYYYVTAYDMMKQESEPSNTIRVIAIPGGGEKFAEGGKEEPSVNTVYRSGYIDNTSFEYPEKKADYGDSLLYELTFDGPSEFFYYYYTPDNNSQKIYVNNAEIKVIDQGDELLKSFNCRLTGMNGDVIIKIKGDKGSAYMSFLGIIDCESKETKGSTETISLNEEDREIRLLNLIVRNELQIAGLEESVEKIQLEIYDVQGRRVIDEKIEEISDGVFRLNHRLPNGIYFLRLKSERELYTTKFTIIR